MEVELYELVTSDICKLVYGFLLEIDLFHIAVEFLNNTHYLLEFARARRQNKMFIHRVNGLTLQEWLEKASLVYSVENYVNQKCSQFKIDKTKMKNKNILEQIDILFDHVQKRSMNSKRNNHSPFHSCHVQESCNRKKAVDEYYDENLFKHLTDKDKKILVDVFENKNTVSEHLAQKISEQLNKQPHQGSPNINDLAHQVAENTVSDDIFHDLCAEMYEEGFLSESLSAKYRSPRKSSPLKTPTTPSRGIKCSPVKSEVLTPSSQMGPQIDLRSPQSSISSQLRINQSPISSIIQTIQRTNQSINTTDHSGDSSKTFNSSAVEVCGDKTYHVMRPMSAASDDVASASSIDTSMSTYSVYTTGLSTTPGSSRYTVLPPPPTPTAAGQFIMPLNQRAQAANPGQTTSLLFVPVVSQGNLIVQSPVTVTAPLLAPFPNTVQSPLNSSSVLNPFQQRYSKVKPKHPRSRSATCNSQPYSITVQEPAQNDNVVPSETNQISTSSEEVPSESYTKVDAITTDRINPNEPKKLVSHIVETNDSNSPYKLGKFISFNDSNVQEAQESNKNQISENVTSTVEINHRQSHDTSDATETPYDNTSSKESNLPASLPTINENIHSSCDKNSTDKEKNASVSSIVSEEISPSKISISQDMNIQDDFEHRRERTSTPKALTVKEGQDKPPQSSFDKSKSTIVDHEIPSDSIEQNETNLCAENNTSEMKMEYAQIRNEQLVSNTEYAEYNENPTEENDCILNDSVKLIIINGDDDAPLDVNEEYGNCQEITLSSGLSMNTVVVINEEPCTGTLIIEREEVNTEVVCLDNTHCDGEKQETVEKTCTDETACEISVHQDEESSKKMNVAETSNEDIEPNACNDKNLKQFYLIQEPRHVYEVVNNTKDVPGTLNKPNADEVSSPKKPKSKSSTRKQKVTQKKEKSLVVAKENVKSTKESPPLSKDTLYSKIISASDSDKPSSSKLNNASLDFLNSSCKVTPAVKVLSTPKRKSSSTPRRSHVRALKFETPLKPSGLKRKCNTSPKENRSQVPFTFERIEKPKNVSRNLCEDVEMKKDTVREKTPWDLGLRELVKFPDSAKLSPSEIAKRRRKKSPKKIEKKKNKRGAMKTITEELNNSHDNAKCSVDAQQDFTKENEHPCGSRTEESKTARDTFESDFKSNEGSCISLNIEDTPLKIADFQDDFHENMKTPSKGLLFSSRNLSLTPIDNIIRNNLGESESLLKIIEDINMFKETPIKEALENLSDKSKTPSPQKSKEGCGVSQDLTSLTQDKSIKKTTTKDKNKRKVSKPKRTAKAVNDCKTSYRAVPNDNFSKSSCTTSRKKRNSKQNQKQVEDVQKPVRRSLRSNSSMNKKSCIGQTEKDLNSTTIRENEEQKSNGMKQSKEHDHSLSQNSDVINKTELVISNPGISESLPNSCSDKDNSICLERNSLDTTEENKNQISHLTKPKYEKMSTFLDDCLSENEKLHNHSPNMNSKENTRKRSNIHTLEKEDERKIKKKKICDNENTTNKTNMSNKIEKKYKETSSMDTTSSPDRGYCDMKESEIALSPTKSLSESEMKEEIPKNKIQHLCEKAISSESADCSGKKKESAELNTSCLFDSDDKRDIIELKNTDRIVQMVEISDYPLNLSASSSNKENSSTMDIDLNVTEMPSDNIVSPIKQTCKYSEVSERESICQVREIKSNQSSSNIENSIIDTRKAEENTTANVILSEDESEDAEDNKLFISISHKENQESLRPKKLTDVIKNFNWTLEVDIGAKLDLSTFSHNIVNLEPRL